MAEFKDSSLWRKLALLICVIGFALLLYAFAVGLGVGGGHGTDGCIVVGFLCFLTATVLILCIVFLDELKDNKPALICFIVFALVAGIITVIGIAMWGGSWGKNKNVIGGATIYASMLGACGSLLAILAGIFAILDLAGVKGG